MRFAGSPWRCVLLLFALAGAACATTAHSPAAARAQLGARLLTRYVQPRTAQLAQGSRELVTALDAYCARPLDAAVRTRVERGFAAVVADWSAVEILRFGPLVEANRLEQFFLWPDARGVVQRQVRSLLAALDAAALDQAQLAQQSVAVQGVPALEYALYADDAVRVIAADEAPGRYRCAFARAVAGNLARVAGEIAAGWRRDAPMAREFARPAPANTVYRSGDEIATEALKAIATALHAVRDQKLLPALGDDIAAARPALLPLQRSTLTARLIGAQARALQDWYEATGLGASLPTESAWVDGALRDELHRVQEDLTALTIPVAQALTDADQRDLLVHAALVLANARDIVEQHLAPALGVNLGFNSLDGD